MYIGPLSQGIKWNSIHWIPKDNDNYVTSLILHKSYKGSVLIEELYIMKQYKKHVTNTKHIYLKERT